MASNYLGTTKKGKPFNTASFSSFVRKSKPREEGYTPTSSKNRGILDTKPFTIQSKPSTDQPPELEDTGYNVPPIPPTGANTSNMTPNYLGTRFNLSPDRLESFGENILRSLGITPNLNPYNEYLGRGASNSALVQQLLALSKGESPGLLGATGDARGGASQALVDRVLEGMKSGSSGLDQNSISSILTRAAGGVDSTDKLSPAY